VAGSEPQSEAPDFERVIQETLDSLPPEIAEQISNVGFVIEDEPPPDKPLLGLYYGVPQPKRGQYYGGVLPDKITIYRGPLERHYGHDHDLLTKQIRRVVLHEIAHHFGISDERLKEIDRY
jgi:predicted Zn-dependent protease with MMP-like domain